MEGRSELDAGNEPDFLWRHFRSWVHFRLLVARGWLRHGHFIRARKIHAYLDAHRVRKVHLGSTTRSTASSIRRSRTRCRSTSTAGFRFPTIRST
jgi:hypothetical protein